MKYIKVENSLSEPVAIVTAASQGMGAACARELANRGYRLSLLARSAAVETVAAELSAITQRGSITHPDTLAALVSSTLDTYGRIDAVVCNTGHPSKGDLLDLSDEDWHQGIDLVLLSVVRLARLITPVMQAQGKGAWVHISAFGAVEPGLKFPVSSTIRAALSAYTKLYADRYAAENIRMNCVLPGFINTRDFGNEVVEGIPFKRTGTVAEIAETVAFLLSDGAGYITGQNIRVDGGMTRSI